MVQDSRDSLKRLKDAMEVATQTTVYALAVACQLIGKSEKPGKDVAAKKVGEFIFPGYNFEDPNYRPRSKKRVREEGEEGEESEEGEEAEEGEEGEAREEGAGGQDS